MAQKWELLAIFSILPYTDGFLGPPNIAICTFFKFCPDSLLKIRFFATLWKYWGGDMLANRPKISKIDPKKPSV